MINAYDFDGTIYNGDSSVDFYFFCLKKNKKILRQLPIQILGIFLYIFKIIDKTAFKERIFSFLKQINDIDLYVEEFWKIHKKNIYPWYLKQKKKTDVIISASPEFLLKPLERELKVEIIASQVNKKTGKFMRKNCHDYEKITRFEEKHNNKTIHQFYSDSIKSDRPMLEYAQEGYLIEKGKVYQITDLLNKKTIILSYKKELFFKLLLLVSWPFLGLFLTITDKIGFILFNSIIMFSVVLFLLTKIKIRTLDKKRLLISVLIACYIDKLFINLFNVRFNMFQNLLISKTNIESIRFIFYSFVTSIFYPTILFCVYWFNDKIVPIIIKEFKSINKIEKKYLTVVLILAFIFSLGTTLVTSAFSVPWYDEEKQYYDVIYTSDNGYITSLDSWMNPENSENDFRQPLFAVFSMPIAITCHLASELLFFVPKDIAYYTLMSVAQYLLFAISIILIARMINIRDKEKKYLFYLFSISFPYVLFGIVLEQYAVGLFYLIATIYYYFRDKEKINYLYIGAVGTLITSGMLFPFITKFNNLKDWLKKDLNCLLIFILLLVLSGQFAQLFTLRRKIIFLQRFTGNKVLFADKFIQFTHFLKSLFLSPKGFVTKNQFDIFSYQQISYETISIIGLAVIAIAIISFIVNRKEKIALVAFYWVIFSFVVLVIVGWGAPENGQILYSSYFSWAYYVLYFLLLNRIKNRKIFKLLILTSIIIIFIPMVMEMSNILKFSIYYFPR